MNVDVLDIFVNKIQGGYGYCRICLRCEPESLIVESRHSTALANIFDCGFIFEGENKRSVCNMCEAYSRNAMRLYDAFRNATKVKRLLQNLALFTLDDRAKLPHVVKVSAHSCNEKLQKLRQETTLKETDVLVVDSDGVLFPYTPNAVPPSAVVPAPNATPFVTDFRHTTALIGPAEPSVGDTVIIDDDDDVVLVGGDGRERDRVDEILGTNSILIEIEDETDPDLEETPTKRQSTGDHQFDSTTDPLSDTSGQMRNNKTQLKARQKKPQPRLRKIAPTPKLRQQAAMLQQKLTQQQTLNNNLTTTQQEPQQQQTVKLVTQQSSLPVSPLMPRLVPINVFLATKNEYVAAKLPGDDKLIVRTPNDVLFCVLHNIVNKNGRLYVPTLSCELRDDALVYAPAGFNVTPVLEFKTVESGKNTKVEASIVLQERDKSEGYLDIVIQEEKSEVDGILRNCLQKMVSKKNKVHESPSNENNIAQHSIINEDVATPLGMISNVSSLADTPHMSSLGVISDVKSVCTDERQTNVDDATNKTKTGRTDWEDKIPMDIISFVEPDADMLILPH